ncbi:DUF1127 domain-containing protein [Roseobacteraceae bacterium S113]
MAQAQTVTALSYLQNRPLTPAASLALYAAVVLVSWAERRRTRLALHQLDDHLLKDVGLSRFEAASEHDKPFWQS